MVFVSLTRLRVRSFWYLVPFGWNTWKSMRQAQRAPGYLGGRLLREERNTFWTVTLWVDGDAMAKFRASGAHGAVMPKLMDWCDEASVAHWNQEASDLPSWPKAHQHMVREGRVSKVRYPSAMQSVQEIPMPKVGRVEQVLEPLPPRG